MYLLIDPTFFSLEHTNKHMQIFCKTYAKLWSAWSLQDRVLQTFLSEGHISYYITLPWRDMIRNVVVLGYITFYQINNSLVNITLFKYINILHFHY